MDSNLDDSRGSLSLQGSLHRASTSIVNLFSSSKSSSKRKRFFSALSLPKTHQFSSSVLFEKYFKGKEQQARMADAFRDHAMSSLIGSCPMHQKAKSIKLAPLKSLSFIKSNDDLDLDGAESMDARHSSSESMDREQLISTLLENAQFGDSVLAKDAQQIVRFRECNHADISDSFAHFLVLYFDAVWSESTSKKASDGLSDITIVERFIKYLRLLHSDYLAGKCTKDAEEKESDIEENEQDGGAISMDEYRIFVEFICHKIEMSLMRKHPQFQESDLSLLTSLKYHLSKLSLMISGQIPCKISGKAAKSKIGWKAISVSIKAAMKFKEGNKLIPLSFC